MLRIIMPRDKRLVWYLAAEEVLAQHISEPTWFFWWVKPTVIFGRHQVMADEVNMPYCESHNVQMYRRKSGGGCVYSDEGNLMISYITPDTHSEQVFQQYLDYLALALSRLGLPAVKSEHNDVLVGDRKVSGNACYALPSGTIVHGTMLYNVDFAALEEAITPSREKLAKHGVQSVRQRVVNLSEFSSQVPASIERLEEYLGTFLCDAQTELTPELVDAIDRIEQTYLDPDFIRGHIQ